MNNSKIIIFTDLDGTLLERESYSPAAALDAVRLAQADGVPIVFCSSKTRAEQLVHRTELGIRDPFIVEDGGAVYLGQDYFPFETDAEPITDALVRLKFGTSYSRIQNALDVVKSETGLTLQGYASLTVADVAAITGLSREAAGRAKQREFEETIVSPLSQQEAVSLTEPLERHGLRLSRGSRFHAVLGKHDKGMAVRTLMELYRRQLGDVVSVGIGDSANDLPMLAAVDRPVLVQKESGVWEECNLPNLERVPAVGPAGWSRYVKALLNSTPIS